MSKIFFMLVLGIVALLGSDPGPAVAAPSILFDPPPSLEESEAAPCRVAVVGAQHLLGVSFEVTYEGADLGFLYPSLAPGIPSGSKPMFAVKPTPGSVSMDIVFGSPVTQAPDTLVLCYLTFIVLDAAASPPSLTRSSYLDPGAPQPSPAHPRTPQRTPLPPQVLDLGQNLPNPFNPETSISFDLPNASAVTMSVFDVTGRQVISIMDHVLLPPGRHRVSWDGMDDQGRPVPPGVYFYRIDTGNWTRTKKMVLVR